jgi:hypothetical protein
MLDAGCWTLEAIAIKKMKFYKKPQRGDKKIAQGKRASAQPWERVEKQLRAPAGAKENKPTEPGISVAPPGLSAGILYL